MYIEFTSASTATSHEGGAKSSDDNDRVKYQIDGDKLLVNACISSLNSNLSDRLKHKSRMLGGTRHCTCTDATVRNGVLIVLDWDDTLFPTSYVCKVVRPCEASDPSFTLQGSIFSEALRHHAELVRKTLIAAREFGSVAIVTLATREWFEESVRRYLLGLDLRELFEELDIPVYYSRDYLTPRYKAKLLLCTDKSIDSFTVCKTMSMAKLLRRKRHNFGQVRNVLSIGDSTTEQDAIKDAIWRCNDPPLCKTMLLVPEPALDVLGGQLESITTWMQDMITCDSDFDIVLSLARR